MVRIRIEPPGVTVDVEPGTSVFDAARSAGVMILGTCAGRGTCGKCVVRVIEGDPGPADGGPMRAPLPGNFRLSCLFRPESDVTVSPRNLVRPPSQPPALAGIPETSALAVVPAESPAPLPDEPRTPASRDDDRCAPVDLESGETLPE